MNKLLLAIMAGAAMTISSSALYAMKDMVYFINNAKVPLHIAQGCGYAGKNIVTHNFKSGDVLPIGKISPDYLMIESGGQADIYSQCTIQLNDCTDPNNNSYTTETLSAYDPPSGAIRQYWSPHSYGKDICLERLQSTVTKKLDGDHYIVTYNIT